MSNPRHVTHETKGLFRSRQRVGTRTTYVQMTWYAVHEAGHVVADLDQFPDAVPWTAYVVMSPVKSDGKVRGGYSVHSTARSAWMRRRFPRRDWIADLAGYAAVSIYRGESWSSFVRSLTGSAERNAFSQDIAKVLRGVARKKGLSYRKGWVQSPRSFGRSPSEYPQELLALQELEVIAKERDAPERHGLKVLYLHDAKRRFGHRLFTTVDPCN